MGTRMSHQPIHTEPTALVLHVQQAAEDDYVQAGLQCVKKVQAHIAQQKDWHISDVVSKCGAEELQWVDLVMEGTTHLLPCHTETDVNQSPLQDNNSTK
jgi:hypothetical protein